MTEPNPFQHVVAIAVGGAAGAVCRHLVNLISSRFFGTHFAFGTLTVNLLGCFLIGMFFAIELPRAGTVTHSALTIGFLGALTTFSTFGFQTAQHFENAQHDLGLLNIACNMLLGLAAVYGGLQLGRLWAA